MTEGSIAQTVQVAARLIKTKAIDVSKQRIRFGIPYIAL
jgi:hypothetical protein